MIPTLTVLVVEKVPGAVPDLWRYSYLGNAVGGSCLTRDQRPLTLEGLVTPTMIGAQLVDADGHVAHRSLVLLDALRFDP